MWTALPRSREELLPQELKSQNNILQPGHTRNIEGATLHSNMFDLSEHGFETAESGEDRIKRKVSA